VLRLERPIDADPEVARLLCGELRELDAKLGKWSVATFSSSFFGRTCTPSL